MKDVQTEASEIEELPSAHALSLAILLARPTGAVTERDDAAEEENQ